MLLITIVISCLLLLPVNAFAAELVGKRGGLEPVPRSFRAIGSLFKSHPPRFLGATIQ